MSFIIRGIIIGILASIPIGPVAMLVLQKSFNGGWKAGFSCGIGCVIADFIYAMISVFALSWVSDLISAHINLISVIGGLIVSGIGLYMVLRNDVSTDENGLLKKKKRSFSASNTLKAVSMGLSNPGALAVMLALFAFFNMDTSDARFAILISFLVVFAVAVGSCLYWFAFSKLAAKFEDNFKMETLVKINKVSGVLIAVFGIYFILRGFGLVTII